MQLKVGRNLFDINSEDVVMFNGACVMLISREYIQNFNRVTPRMSKTLFNKLLKKEVLYLIKEEKTYITSSGQKMGLWYYKFNLEKLNLFLEHEKVK